MRRQGRTKAVAASAVVAAGALAMALLALSTVTAWVSGRAAMGQNVVRAVKEDW